MANNAKEQITSCQWAKRPDNHRAIYPLLRVGAGTIRTNGGSIEINPEVEGLWAVDRDTQIRPGIKGQVAIDTVSLGELMDKWNAGERWIRVVVQPDMFGGV